QALGLAGVADNFLGDSKALAYWQDELPTTHPVHGPVADTDTALSQFDGITYGKGASWLKQLVHYVGAEPYRKGLQAYFATHSWGNTDFEDFITAIGRSSGKELAVWAKEHLQTTGVDTLRIKYAVKWGRMSNVELHQESSCGDKLLRRHRVEVATFHRGKDG